uniref:MIF4G domain-containing protein n=1 Tax=Globodera pallida TaxID=36090 RepID=A0A183BYY0_GLOPA
MNGHSRQSPVATATPPQATLSQPPEGIGAGGYEEGGGNRGAGGDTPQPQQVPLQQHSQRYQTHREGDSSVPRATFHLPPSTTLMRSDTIPPAQEMYGPTAGGGGGGGIPHATAYQQTAPNIYPQGQATAIYQNIQQAQYYYNPANGHAYYGTTAPGAYMTAGMPQALLMSPQQHQQAYHQQQQMLAAQHMAAAQQSHPQGAMAVPAHHTAAVLMPTATSVAQIPPVSVVSGAGAAVVVAAQQSSTMAAMSATHGAVPPGTTHLPANVVVTSSATGQSIPPQQQLQREKKVLKFVHPDTQKELDLSSGAANEPKRKANSAVDGKEKSAAEETDKTISVKEFQKRVTERMKYGAGGDLKAAEGNGRTPAVTPPPSAQITREGLERLDQTEQVDTVSDWIQTIPNQRLVYGGQASDMHISLDQQQQKDGQQYVSGPVANFVVQQQQQQQQSVVHHQPQLSSTSPPTIAVEQQVIHPFPQSQQQPVPTVQQQQQRLSPGPRIQRLLDMNVVKPTMEQPVEVPEQQTVPKIVSTVVVLQVEEPPVVISPPMVISPPVVISPPAAEEEEEEAVPGDTETIGGGSRKGSQNDLNGEEESAADRLTPTQDGGEEMTEERIRELEEQMQLLEKSDENNDPEQFVYSRKFLYFIRKVTLALKTVNCPKTEDELEELGLSRRGMPTVQSFSVGGKAKRFDGASSDQFKTAWQQPGGGGGGGGGLNQFGTGSGGRFTTSRPPYSGRHSDNKLKPKKGPIARQSLDQRPLKLAQISSSQAAELSKRSTNAWKPKREERFDMSAPTRDEDEIKYEKLCKEVRGLLNKVTPSTYKDLSEDFIQYKIHDDPKLLEMIIDLIFDKAVEEPHFCPLYSDLCERQVEEEKRAMAERQDKQPQEKSFRSEIIQKCQKTFLASNQFDEKISDLKKKMDELDEADEKARTQVEEEIETRRSKEKRRLLGIIRL